MAEGQVPEIWSIMERPQKNCFDGLTPLSIATYGGPRFDAAAVSMRDREKVLTLRSGDFPAPEELRRRRPPGASPL